ncbi:Alpha/Beta hydrolase protein [Lineolata rhizophorae]|uniref:Alpha/Beta hydrolase protein n=1 Tax=Lineolata rhizophorae TaxID=578093 RepID=A0A6A6NV33_9PEZI|nr:Alpha/Beta hydrolase protein [Lineolata rhizophorae]
MADTDQLATKSPEVDAAEQQQAPAASAGGDAMAQEGLTMGEHCVTDRPAPPGERPTGEITKLGGVDAYIAKPNDYPHSPSKLLLLLTGGTGIHSVNNQLQADKYASEGFLVIMPDQFDNDPAPNTTTADPATPTETSFISRVKLGAAEAAKSFLIDMWLARHTPEKVLPVLRRALDGARDEFADAVANGQGVYAAGYCFGAKYVLLLAAGVDAHPEMRAWWGVGGKPKDEEEGGAERAEAGGKEPLIRAGAIAHGTLVTHEDIASVKAPISMVCVKDDSLFPNDVREDGRQALVQAGVEHEVEVYPGVPHGFAVLGNYDDQHIKRSQQQAFGQMLGWLQAH